MYSEKCNISIATGSFLIKFCAGLLKFIRHVLGMFDIFFGCISPRGI
jgi:hypothetical protein